MGTQIRLFADSKGVWRVKDNEHAFGIEWGEIYRVGGYKLDGITESYTCVSLDHENGHCMELNQNWLGFEQVVAAITKQLPGIAPNWVAAIETLAVNDRPLEIWHRSEPRA